MRSREGLNRDPKSCRSTRHPTGADSEVLPMEVMAWFISCGSTVPLMSLSMLMKCCFQPLSTAHSSLNSLKPIEQDMSRWWTIKLWKKPSINRPFIHDQSWYSSKISNTTDLKQFNVSKKDTSSMLIISRHVSMLKAARQRMLKISYESSVYN